MADMLTLVADLCQSTGVRRPPAGIDTRPTRLGDLSSLGRLYFEAYEPGVACDTLEEAVYDVRLSFDCEYGEFWFQASPVALIDEEIVAAVMTVRAAPWDDAPPGPFVIELLTAVEHRRRGLARLLMSSAMETAAHSGATQVGLRVDASNEPALALYRSLGFTRWDSEARHT